MQSIIKSVWFHLARMIFAKLGLFGCVISSMLEWADFDTSVCKLNWAHFVRNVWIKNQNVELEVPFQNLVTYKM